MHNSPCLCDKTEMVYGSSRDSTNYRSQCTMICMSLLQGICPHYSLDSRWMSYIAVLDAMVKRKISVTCWETDPDYPICIFFILQYFNSAYFFQCFASFYVTKFLIHSHLHHYLPLGEEWGGGFFFIYIQNLLGNYVSSHS